MGWLENLIGVGVSAVESTVKAGADSVIPNNKKSSSSENSENNQPRYNNGKNNK